MNLIEHTFSPRRLLLTWQAPAGRGRTRFAVGELRDRNGTICFRYLPQGEDYHRACELGFTGHPAFRTGGVEYTEGVMDAFLRRVPPRSRGDFDRFLKQWRLPAAAGLSDFALLAYCGAKLPTDGFSLVWPLEEVQAPGEVLLEVAGFCQQGIGAEELSAGMPVHFIAEPDNPKDERALRIDADGRGVGYVNHLQRATVAQWLERYEVNAVVEQVNGTADRPTVYVFCRVLEGRPAMLPRKAAGQAMAGK